MSLLHICEHTFLSLEAARTWAKFWSCWSQSSTRPRCASISPWFAVVNCGNVAALETASGAAAARQCRWRAIPLCNAQLPFCSPMLELHSRYCIDIPHQRIYLNSDFPVPISEIRSLFAFYPFFCQEKSSILLIIWSCRRTEVQWGCWQVQSW